MSVSYTGKFYRLFNALLPADDQFHELGMLELFGRVQRAS